MAFEAELIIFNLKSYDQNINWYGIKWKTRIFIYKFDYNINIIRVKTYECNILKDELVIPN